MREMLLLVQVTSILLLTCHAKAEAPSGYVKPTEPQDPNPPKYEYGYNIEDGKGESHGKVETRDGIYALGRYYVQNSDSTHSVQYYADDWGYHPYIEYSNVGPHSRTRTELLLGVEAVKALASNKFTPHSTPAKQQVTDTINSKTAGNPVKSTFNTQPQPNVLQQPQILIEQSPQAVVQQPQQVQHVQHIQHVQQPQQVQHIQHVQQPQQVQQNQQIFIQPPQHIAVQQLPQLVQQQQPDPQANLGQQPQLQQVLVQNQVTNEQPQLQQVLVQHQINHQQPQKNAQIEQVQIQQQITHQQLPSPTQLLFQPAESNTKQIQDNLVVSQQSSEQDLYKSNEATLGGFGTRLNLVGIKRPNYNVQIQQSEKLIETTKNLVSGQDVLNINQAADVIETSTAKSSIQNNLNQAVTHTSLINQPIVVADFNENVVSTTEKPKFEGVKEVICSTTANTVGTFSVSEPSHVLVTPRPISTQFLAPVTAGVQLQNVDSNIRLQENNKESVEIQVQKSLPYYLGKFEYVPSAVGQVETKQSQAVQNLELGKTLLAFPDQQNNQQQLPDISIKDNFVEQQVQVVQQASSTATPFIFENIVEKQVHVPVIQTQIVEKPVQVEKIVKEPYPVPVHVPVEVRVPVEKHVPYPVTVEKIVEKPVQVTQIVEKQVQVPQPYPVEKIVERPVHVPVEVTKYVDRPYPVQVPVAQPVPYPVDRIVEKIVKQPYPVQVQVPVEVRVPYPVEKIVEKKVPVPHYIDRQVPVERIVEKQVPHYIDRPYPVHVQVPVAVPQPYILPLTRTYHQVPLINVQPQLSHATRTIASYQKQEQQQQSTATKVQYLPPQQQNLQQNIKYLPPQQQQQQQQQNNGYLPPPHDCDQQNSFTRQNDYYTIPSNHYIGLSPPKRNTNTNNNNNQNLARKYRNARSNFNSNLRLEYGFMPPLRPSQEIDEHGQPIIREEIN